MIATRNNSIETPNIVNIDLIKIGNWANKWKLQFNANKYKQMLFSNTKLESNPSLIFGNEVVTIVTQHKHLGVSVYIVPQTGVSMSKMFALVLAENYLF